MKQLQAYFSTVPDAHRIYLLAFSISIFWMVENTHGLTLNYQKIKHALTNSYFIFFDAPVQFLLGIGFSFAVHWGSLHHFGLLYWIPNLTNPWIQLVGSFLLLDFFEYVYHVCMHKVKPFWMFHLVHHSERVVDVSSTLREHPGETFIRLSFLILWIFLTGSPFWAVLLRQFIQIISNVFAHANFRLPEKLNNVVGMVLVTPNLHHVHHHYQQPYTDSNYGDVLIIWDRFFGTFRKLEASKIVFGIDTVMDSQENSVFSKLIRLPFRKYHSLVKVLPILILFFLITTTTTAQSAIPDGILGDWISPDKDIIVHCYKEKGLYYGKLIWFKKYLDSPETKESKEAISEEKWQDMVIMRDFKYQNGEWNNGKIFHLKTGNKYDAFIHLKDYSTLELTGYVWLRCLGEKFKFTKIQHEELPLFGL